MYVDIDNAKITLWRYDFPWIVANLQSYNTLMRLGRGKVTGKYIQHFEYKFNNARIFLYL